MSSARRRAPNKTERIAACLLMLKVGDEWLIPEPLRSTGTAKSICAAVDWDHAFLHSLGGDTRPQNITPMTKESHREKTFGTSKATTAGSDIHAAAKSKRLQKKQAEFIACLLAKHGGDEPQRRKAKAPILGSKASGIVKKADRTVIDLRSMKILKRGENWRKHARKYGIEIEEDAA